MKGLKLKIYDRLFKSINRSTSKDVNMNTLLENRIEGLIREKLCKKGQAYRKRRMAAGEKSSAYLSGRAVKVCKGHNER